MFKIKSNDLGDITVEKEVVETIAGLAALDCYGLVGMVPHNIQSGLTQMLGLESIRKGVEVTNGINGLIVDVHVIIGYGIKISEVALSVIQKVAYVLEQGAGIPVEKVNVNVKGVRVIKDL